MSITLKQVTNGMMVIWKRRNVATAGMRHTGSRWDPSGYLLLETGNETTRKVPHNAGSVKGELVGKARLDANLRLGVVSVPHGFQDANVNLLTTTEADPLTGMVRYSGSRVTVHPAPLT